MKRSPFPILGALMVLSALVSAATLQAAAPSGRYTISTSSRTVYDTKTRLTWQEDAAPGTYTQLDAIAYCSNLNLSGTGWRLPTMKELRTIVDFSVAPGSAATIDSNAFPNAPAGGFWSSTPVADSPGWAWVVNFNLGRTDGAVVSSAYNVRCVR